MLKYLIILSALVVICYCQNHNVQHYLPYKKKKKHYPYHLIYAGFTYITFLALKFKLILFFGTIFAMFCVAGKIFAFIRYQDNKKDHGPEKIYIQAPSHHHDFSSSGYPGLDRYSGGYFDDYSPVYNKGRSNEEDTSVYENFDMFARTIRELNITDLAFDSMNLTSVDCKRRFVCEADYNAKHSIVLKAGFDILSDETYSKYKTNKTITSAEECEALYPNCEDYTKKTQGVK